MAFFGAEPETGSSDFGAEPQAGSPFGARAGVGEIDDALIFVDGWQDETTGSAVIEGGLEAAGITDFEQTQSSEDFATRVAENEPDLVIFAVQSTDVPPAGLAALEQHLESGGGVIAVDWTGNQDYLDLLQAERVETNAGVIGTDDHPLFSTVSEPEIPLTNPGWGVWSAAYDPVGDAVGAGHLGDGNAAVIGNAGTSVLLGPLFDSYESVAQGQELLEGAIQLLGVGALEMGLQLPEPDVGSAFFG